MGKLSKYFSLFKFTITNPKNGISILDNARQTEKDSKQDIQKHSANSSNLEKCLELYFPDNYRQPSNTPTNSLFALALNLLLVR